MQVRKECDSWGWRGLRNRLCYHVDLKLILSAMGRPLKLWDREWHVLSFYHQAEGVRVALHSALAHTVDLGGLGKGASSYCCWHSAPFPNTLGWGTAHTAVHRGPRSQVLLRLLEKLQIKWYSSFFLNLDIFGMQIIHLKAVTSGLQLGKRKRAHSEGYPFALERSLSQFLRPFTPGTSTSPSSSFWGSAEQYRWEK